MKKTIDDMMQETTLPVVVADQRGMITHVNKSFETTFGWVTTEIIGKPLTTIIPGSLHDSHHLGFSRFLSTGTPTLLNQPLKLKVATKTGREFDAEHFIIAEKRDGQWTFAATVRPL